MSRGVAIIGAGLGGMAAGIRLASSGFKVDIYEQNDTPGGKAGSFTDAGFRFDTGPSLLTMPFILKDLFNDAGESIDDYLQFKKLDVLCRYFWEDGNILDAYSDLKMFADEVQKNTNDSAAAVINYLKYCRTIYDHTSDIFLFKNPKRIKNYFNGKALKTLLKIKQIDSLRTMHQANSSFFRDEKTVQLFDRYATYNGSDPYKAPATLNLIQHVEYSLGGFIVKGGMYSLTEQIFRLALQKGVSFFFNSRIQSILHNENSVTGIKTNEAEKQYEIVISNSDISTTYKYLMNINDKMNYKNPSSSAVVFYWGVKGTHRSLEIHNILFSSDYKKEFEDIFTKRVCPEDPTIYIYISSKFNTDDAPENCENWFVMINSPSIENQDWEKEIDKSRKAIFKKIKRNLNIDLQEIIVTEKILTPADLENQTGAFRGSIYGQSSNSRLSAFLRGSNKSEKFKGLYFCGGTVHPGGGIPLVMLSGKNASDMIIKDYDKS